MRTELALNCFGGCLLLNRRSIRNLLKRRLRSDADFEAFCLDFFPSVQARFTAGMDRVVKMNLLLEQVDDPEEIPRALRQTRLGAFQPEGCDRGIATKKYLTIWVAIGILLVLLAGSAYRSVYPPADSSTSQRSRGDGRASSPAVPYPQHLEPTTETSAVRTQTNQHTSEVSAVDIESNGAINIIINPNNGNINVSADKIKAKGDVNIGIMDTPVPKVSE